MIALSYIPEIAVQFGWICILFLVLLHEPAAQRATRLVRSLHRK